MLCIDIYSRVPIYQQIIDSVRREISLGILKEGEQLASIRQMSADSGTNPNTVAKAYGELERTGIIAAANGKGYFVADGAAKRLRDETVAKESALLKNVVCNLYASGVSEDDIHDIIRNVYEEKAAKEENEK